MAAPQEARIPPSAAQLPQGPAYGSRPFPGSRDPQLATAGPGGPGQVLTGLGGGPPGTPCIACSPGAGSRRPQTMTDHPSLLLLCMGLTSCLGPSSSEEQDQEVFLGSPEAQSFLASRRRVPRANHWDLELFTPGNLERECHEERCSWEEAREYFEDNILTERFWESYIYNGKGGRGRIDVAGLAVGLTCGLLLIVLAGLGAFWYLHYRRGRSQQSCPQETGLISPLNPRSPLEPPTPPPPPPPPGLPTYEQALAASGVHDAPPPPYSSLRRPH